MRVCPFGDRLTDTRTRPQLAPGDMRQPRFDAVSLGRSERILNEPRLSVTAERWPPLPDDAVARPPSRTSPPNGSGLREVVKDGDRRLDQAADRVAPHAQHGRLHHHRLRRPVQHLPTLRLAHPRNGGNCCCTTRQPTDSSTFHVRTPSAHVERDQVIGGRSTLSSRNRTGSDRALSMPAGSAAASAVNGSRTRGATSQHGDSTDRAIDFDMHRY